jgi:hypothetical protein
MKWQKPVSNKAEQLQLDTKRVRHVLSRGFAGVPDVGPRGLIASPLDGPRR